ncbi:MAG TPA: GLPGLI family protein [Chitinophagaceae bacterium]|nr:GLPGLI family protein [Chitinophagaceae bacterium]
MKSFLLAIGLSCWALAAVAQQPDTARIAVHYKFTHIRDTTHPNNPDRRNMVLLVGKTASAYRAYGPQTQQDIARQTKQLSSAVPDRPSPLIYFQFIRDKKLSRRDPILFTNFVVSEPLPVIRWHISDDTASFGGLRCQKATCHFKGRDYIAWFCPDLPVPAGPWKLNGLPGVIVDACDTKKEVCFTFDGVERIVGPVVAGDESSNGRPPMGGGPLIAEGNQLIIKMPANATPTTEKELARLIELGRKDPKALVTALVGPQEPGTPGPKIDMMMAPAPVENNPIELPEKK